MITSYLQGGLGNQMFQIAAAYAHAKKNYDTAVFDLNNSYTPHQGQNISKYKTNIFNGFNHMDNVYDLCNNTFTQPSHSYCDIPYFNNQQLQGYFQSEKFFINNKTELINLFIEGLKSHKSWFEVEKDFKDIRLLLRGEIPIVSIHIRRGDYLKFLGIHDPCPIEYYQESIKLMKDKIGNFQPYFISDDIEWCKTAFNGIGMYSNKKDELEDMIIMLNCDHNIIANSSFSWWGAYLNNNNNKIVIGPEKWFGHYGPKDQDDIIPINWIKIWK
jgi:hypothetical protein